MKSKEKERENKKLNPTKREANEPKNNKHNYNINKNDLLSNKSQNKQQPLLKRSTQSDFISSNTNSYISNHSKRSVSNDNTKLSRSNKESDFSLSKNQDEMNNKKYCVIIDNNENTEMFSNRYRIESQYNIRSKYSNFKEEHNDEDDENKELNISDNSNYNKKSNVGEKFMSNLKNDNDEVSIIMNTEALNSIKSIDKYSNSKQMNRCSSNLLSVSNAEYLYNLISNSLSGKNVNNTNAIYSMNIKNANNTNKGYDTYYKSSSKSGISGTSKNKNEEEHNNHSLNKNYNDITSNIKDSSSTINKITSNNTYRNTFSNHYNNKEILNKLSNIKTTPVNNNNYFRNSQSINHTNNNTNNNNKSSISNQPNISSYSITNIYQDFMKEVNKNISFVKSNINKMDKITKQEKKNYINSSKNLFNVNNDNSSINNNSNSSHFWFSNILSNYNNLKTDSNFPIIVFKEFCSFNNITTKLQKQNFNLLFLKSTLLLKLVFIIVLAITPFMLLREKGSFSCIVVILFFILLIISLMYYKNLYCSLLNEELTQLGKRISFKLNSNTNVHGSIVNNTQDVGSNKNNGNSKYNTSVIIFDNKNSGKSIITNKTSNTNTRNTVTSVPTSNSDSNRNSNRNSKSKSSLKYRNNKNKNNVALNDRNIFKFSSTINTVKEINEDHYNSNSNTNSKDLNNNSNSNLKTLYSNINSNNHGNDTDVNQRIKNSSRFNSKLKLKSTLGNTDIQNKQSKPFESNNTNTNNKPYIVNELNEVHKNNTHDVLLSKTSSVYKTNQLSDYYKIITFSQCYTNLANLLSFFLISIIVFFFFFGFIRSVYYDDSSVNAIRFLYIQILVICCLVFVIKPKIFGSELFKQSKLLFYFNNLESTHIDKNSNTITNNTNTKSEFNRIRFNKNWTIQNNNDMQNNNKNNNYDNLPAVSLAGGIIEDNLNSKSSISSINKVVNRNSSSNSNLSTYKYKFPSNKDNRLTRLNKMSKNSNPSNINNNNNTYKTYLKTENLINNNNAHITKLKKDLLNQIENYNSSEESSKTKNQIVNPTKTKQIGVIKNSVYTNTKTNANNTNENKKSSINTSTFVIPDFSNKQTSLSDFSIYLLSNFQIIAFILTTLQITIISQSFENELTNMFIEHSVNFILNIITFTIINNVYNNKKPKSFIKSTVSNNKIINANRNIKDTTNNLNSINNINNINNNNNNNNNNTGNFQLKKILKSSNGYSSSNKFSSNDNFNSSNNNSSRKKNKFHSSNNEDGTNNNNNSNSKKLRFADDLDDNNSICISNSRNDFQFKQRINNNAIKLKSNSVVNSNANCKIISNVGSCVNCGFNMSKYNASKKNLNTNSNSKNSSCNNLDNSNDDADTAIYNSKTHNLLKRNNLLNNLNINSSNSRNINSSDKSKSNRKNSEFDYNNSDSADFSSKNSSNNNDINKKEDKENKDSKDYNNTSRNKNKHKHYRHKRFSINYSKNIDSYYSQRLIASVDLKTIREFNNNNYGNKGNKENKENKERIRSPKKVTSANLINPNNCNSNTNNNLNDNDNSNNLFSNTSTNNQNNYNFNQNYNNSNNNFISINSISRILTNSLSKSKLRSSSLSNNFFNSNHFNSNILYNHNNNHHVLALYSQCFSIINNKHSPINTTTINIQTNSSHSNNTNNIEKSKFIPPIIAVPTIPNIQTPIPVINEQHNSNISNNNINNITERGEIAEIAEYYDTNTNNNNNIENYNSNNINNITHLMNKRSGNLCECCSFDKISNVIGLLDIGICAFKADIIVDKGKKTIMKKNDILNNCEVNRNKQIANNELEENKVDTNINNNENTDNDLSVKIIENNKNRINAVHIKTVLYSNNPINTLLNKEIYNEAIETNEANNAICNDFYNNSSHKLTSFLSKLKLDEELHINKRLIELIKQKQKDNYFSIMEKNTNSNNNTNSTTNNLPIKFNSILSNNKNLQVLNSLKSKSKSKEKSSSSIINIVNNTNNNSNNNISNNKGLINGKPIITGINSNKSVIGNIVNSGKNNSFSLISFIINMISEYDDYFNQVNNDINEYNNSNNKLNRNISDVTPEIIITQSNNNDDEMNFGNNQLKLINSHKNYHEHKSSDDCNTNINKYTKPKNHHTSISKYKASKFNNNINMKDNSDNIYNIDFINNYNDINNDNDNENYRPYSLSPSDNKFLNSNNSININSIKNNSNNTNNNNITQSSDSNVIFSKQFNYNSAELTNHFNNNISNNNNNEFTNEIDNKDIRYTLDLNSKNKRLFTMNNTNTYKTSKSNLSGFSKKLSDNTIISNTGLIFNNEEEELMNLYTNLLFKFNNNYYQLLFKIIDSNNNNDNENNDNSSFKITKTLTLTLINTTTQTITIQNIHNHMADKQKKLSYIAHEFKTPLNTIISLANQIKTKIVTKKSIVEDVTNIEAISSYTFFLIADFIQISKNNDSVSIAKTQIDLKLIFQFCLNITKTLVGYYYDNKYVKCELIISEELDNLIVEGDEVRLKQVLLNFISNSVKFTKKGKVQIICSVVKFPERIQNVENIEEKRYEENDDKLNNINVNYDENDNRRVNIEESNYSILEYENNNLYSIDDLVLEKREQKKETKENNTPNSIRNRDNNSSDFRITNTKIIDNQSTPSPPTNKNNNDIKDKINNLPPYPYIKIIIKDTGCGISKTQLKEINSKTSNNIKVDRTNNSAGTGLGIKLTKQILSNMEYSFKVHSKQGKGTETTIYITNGITLKQSKLSPLQKFLSTSTSNSLSMKKLRKKISMFNLSYRAKSILIDNFSSYSNYLSSNSNNNSNTKLIRCSNSNSNIGGKDKYVSSNNSNINSNSNGHYIRGIKFNGIGNTCKFGNNTDKLGLNLIKTYSSKLKKPRSFNQYYKRNFSDKMLSQSFIFSNMQSSRLNNYFFESSGCYTLGNSVNNKTNSNSNNHSNNNTKSLNIRFDNSQRSSLNPEMIFNNSIIYETRNENKSNDGKKLKSSKLKQIRYTKRKRYSSNLNITYVSKHSSKKTNRKTTNWKKKHSQKALTSNMSNMRISKLVRSEINDNYETNNNRYNKNPVYKSNKNNKDYKDNKYKYLGSIKSINEGIDTENCHSNTLKSGNHSKSKLLNSNMNSNVNSNSNNSNSLLNSNLLNNINSNSNNLMNCSGFNKNNKRLSVNYNTYVSKDLSGMYNQGNSDLKSQSQGNKEKPKSRSFSVCYNNDKEIIRLKSSNNFELNYISSMNNLTFGVNSSKELRHSKKLKINNDISETTINCNIISSRNSNSNKNIINNLNQMYLNTNINTNSNINKNAKSTTIQENNNSSNNGLKNNKSHSIPKKQQDNSSQISNDKGENNNNNTNNYNKGSLIIEKLKLNSMKRNKSVSVNHSSGTNNNHHSNQHDNLNNNNRIINCNLNNNSSSEDSFDNTYNNSDNNCNKNTIRMSNRSKKKKQGRLSNRNDRKRNFSNNNDSLLNNSNDANTPGINNVIGSKQITSYDDKISSINKSNKSKHELNTTNFNNYSSNITSTYRDKEVNNNDVIEKDNNIDKLIISNNNKNNFYIKFNDKKINKTNDDGNNSMNSNFSEEDDIETERRDFDPDLDSLFKYLEKRRERERKENNNDKLPYNIKVTKTMSYENDNESRANNNNNNTNSKNINTNNNNNIHSSIENLNILNSNKLSNYSPSTNAHKNKLSTTNFDLYKQKSSSSKTLSKHINNDNEKIILVIDDVVPPKEAIKKIIEKISFQKKIHYKVILANDGVDLLWYIINDQKKSQIKMIITDENMTYMDGSQALNVLNEIRSKLCQVPFLICSTSYEEDEIKNQLKNFGFNDVITKSPSEDAIIKLLFKFGLISDDDKIEKTKKKDKK